MKNWWQSAEGNLIFPPLTHRLTDSLSHDDRFMMSWCWLFVRLSFVGGWKSWIYWFFLSLCYESNNARMRDISISFEGSNLNVWRNAIFSVMWKISCVHVKFVHVSIITYKIEFIENEKRKRKSLRKISEWKNLMTALGRRWLFWILFFFGFFSEKSKENRSKFNAVFAMKMIKNLMDNFELFCRWMKRTENGEFSSPNPNLLLLLTLDRSQVASFLCSIRRFNFPLCVVYRFNLWMRRQRQDRGRRTRRVNGFQKAILIFFNNFVFHGRKDWFW